MVVSTHLTHFCYPIRLVLYQHLNLRVAYPGIPPEFRPVSCWSFTWLNRIALESLSMDTICDIIRDTDFIPTLDAYFELVCSLQAYITDHSLLKFFKKPNTKIIHCSHDSANTHSSKNVIFLMS